MADLSSPRRPLGTPGAGAPGPADNETVTLVYDASPSVGVVDATLVDMSASTVRVRLPVDTELPDRQRTYVVVVHREPAMFLLTERVEGESDPDMARFARVTRAS